MNIPKEGQQVLANYKEEWLVLEIGYETPTYEENFSAFYYWFEPTSDLLVIESLEDVEEWIALDDIIKGQVKINKTGERPRIK